MIVSVPYHYLSFSFYLPGHRNVFFFFFFFFSIQAFNNKDAWRLNCQHN